MYEAVRAAPDGDSTVARFAATAADLGFDGVVVRSRQDARPEFDADAIRDAYGVDVVRGVEIAVEDRERASGYLGSFRPEHTVVAVRGGSPAMNRFAVESDGVDVLAAPMADEGDVNHVLARAAADHGVRLEFDLSRVLRASGGTRVRAVQGLRKLRELVEQYEPPFVVSAFPTSHLQLRSPRDLVAVAEQVGFSEEQVRTGLAEWRRLADRNRERLSDEFIAPGVKRGRYEEDG
jgi:ribonuclease P/MRP protein subunit RPP1